MPVFTLDAKFFASVDVEADTEEAARAKLAAAWDGHEVEAGGCIGTLAMDGDAVLTEIDHVDVDAHQDPMDAAPPEPPWPVGRENAKREGWKAYFNGRARDRCPFPTGMPTLHRDFRIGWDLAASHPGAPPADGPVS